MVYGAFVARCKKLSKNFTIAHNDNFIKKILKGLKQKSLILDRHNINHQNGLNCRRNVELCYTIY